jgi:hypothetical protein
MAARVSPEELLALEDARSRAMLSANIVELSALLADSVTYGHSNGTTDDKRELLQKFESGRLRFTDVRLLQRTLRASDGCALVTGRMQASAVIDGDPRSIDTAYLAVWMPESESAGEVWRLHAYQGTGLPQQPNVAPNQTA